MVVFIIYGLWLQFRMRLDIEENEQEDNKKLHEGSKIAIYDVTGQLVGSGKATAETTNISTQLCNGDIAIVKIGNRAVKVVVK